MTDRPHEWEPVDLGGLPGGEVLFDPPATLTSSPLDALHDTLGVPAEPNPTQAVPPTGPPSPPPAYQVPNEWRPTPAQAPGNPGGPMPRNRTSPPPAQPGPAAYRRPPVLRRRASPAALIAAIVFGFPLAGSILGSFGDASDGSAQISSEAEPQYFPNNPEPNAVEGAMTVTSPNSIRTDSDVVMVLTGSGGTVGGDLDGLAGATHVLGAKPTVIHLLPGEVTTAHVLNLSGAPDLRCEIQADGNVVASAHGTDILVCIYDPTQLLENP